MARKLLVGGYTAQGARLGRREEEGERMQRATNTQQITMANIDGNLMHEGNEASAMAVEADNGRMVVVQTGELTELVPGMAVGAGHRGGRGEDPDRPAAARAAGGDRVVRLKPSRPTIYVCAVEQSQRAAQVDRHFITFGKGGYGALICTPLGTLLEHRSVRVKRRQKPSAVAPAAACPLFPRTMPTQLFARTSGLSWGR